MTLLTPILIVPAAAGLLCLLLRSRRAMALANVLAFAVTLALSLQLLPAVLQPPLVVTECDGFFRADALSAWMVLLISVVSLGSALYAGRYFQRDLAAGAVTAGRVKEFYVLTPLFSAGMFLVVLANNLGVMWFALEATALSSVLLVANVQPQHLPRGGAGNTSSSAAWAWPSLCSARSFRTRRPLTSAPLRRCPASTGHT